jgi:hydrogenase expression/formation protein HypC
MCIAIPGKIIEMEVNIGKVLVMGVETTVNMQLIQDPVVGDYVLVHVGCAIEKINKEYHDDLLSYYHNLFDGADFQ